MNTHIDNQNLIPILLELGWMVKKETWTDCPADIYQKLGNMTEDEIFEVLSH